MTVILTDGTVKNLGKISSCTHSFGEWKTVLEATCTSIGYGTRECEVCGYIEYEFTAAAGHKWDKEELFSDKVLKTCSECSAIKLEDKYVPTEEDLKFILPVSNAVIVLKFGDRVDTLGYIWHTAVDFACEQGESVVAALGGKVTEIGGDYITIEHFYGYITKYTFVAVNGNIKVGDKVKQGDVIGTVASASGTESYLGDHIHFEYAVNGKAEDPIEYFNPDDLKYADE